MTGAITLSLARAQFVPPSGRFAPLQAQAQKQKPKSRMLILLSNRIHGKALWIQLDNVQISSTELKSSLKACPRFAWALEFQMTKNQNQKHPRFAWILDLQMIKPLKANSLASLVDLIFK